MISVIIITSGNSQYLDSLIKSVRLRNVKVSFEIIVVSNIALNLETVKVVYNPKFKGYAHACNLGASKSEGDYLLFLNDDMLCGKEALYQLKETLESNKKYGIVAPKLVNADFSYQSSFYFSYTSYFTVMSSGVRNVLNLFLRPFSVRLDIWGMTIRGLNKRVSGAHAMGSALFMSLDVFTQIKGFDENIYLTFEDQLICYSILALNLDVVYEPKSVFVHYGNRTVRGLDNFNEIYNDSLKYFLKVKNE